MEIKSLRDFMGDDPFAFRRKALSVGEPLVGTCKTYISIPIPIAISIPIVALGRVRRFL